MKNINRNRVQIRLNQYDQENWKIIEKRLIEVNPNIKINDSAILRYALGVTADKIKKADHA
jgi:hypothetical protein